MSRELSFQRLQEYLRQVIDLEIQCQTADKAYNNYKVKAGQLAVAQNYAPPKKPNRREAGFGEILKAIGEGFIQLAICAGLALLLNLFCDSYHGDSLILNVLVTLLDSFSGFIIPILLLGGLGIGGYIAYIGIADVIKWNKERKQQIQQYQSASKNYELWKTQDAARMQRESQQKATLQKDTALLDERRRKSAELLDKYYALDVIKPKYRNLLCVATFLEYLENERCYTLTGPDGCYNKFEEERRQGIIIAQLTNISRQLEQIRQNQERVADALTAIQQNTNYLCAGLQQVNEKLDVIQQDTRTAAWYSQQAAEDQRAMNNYVMMRDWINS